MSFDPQMLEHQSPHDIVCVSWEESACPLCDGARCVPLLEAADPRRTGMRFLVVRCDRCDFVYTNPRPDADSILAFYDDPGRNQLDLPTPRVSRGDAMCRRLARRRAGRLLDFGCGDGAFLAEMQRRGWEVAGLDTDEDAVERAIELHGLPVELGTLPNPHWNASRFDAITMRQSLEHVHRPLDTLREACQLLTPSGVLMVSVPNFDSLAAGWFGPDWYALDLPRHLSHFTPRTLHAILKKAGFDRIEIRADRHASWIRHSVEHMICERIVGTSTRFMRTRIGSRLFSLTGMLMGKPESLLAVATK